MDTLPLFGQIAALSRIAPDVSVQPMYTGFFADLYATMTSVQQVDAAWFRANGGDPTAPVLDLCGGSGRLGRALGGTDALVVVVDDAPDMLAHARRAAVPGERLDVVLADVLSLDLGRRFGRIVCGGLAYSMFGPDERRRLLTVAAQHLAPGGRVLFDHLPAVAGEVPSEVCVPMPVPDGTPGFVLLAAQRDPAARVMRTNIFAELDVPGGPTRRLVTAHELRLIEHTQLADELADVALGVVTQHDVTPPARPGEPGWPVRFVSAQRVEDATG